MIEAKGQQHNENTCWSKHIQGELLAKRLDAVELHVALSTGFVFTKEQSTPWSFTGHQKERYLNQTRA